MMKKLLLSTLGASVLCLVLSGCTAQVDVPDITSNAAGSSAAGSSVADNSVASNAGNANSTGAPDLTQVTQQINALQAQVDGVVAPADLSGRTQAYYDYKAQVDTLDLTLDQLDDQLDLAYRTGGIAMQGYQSMDAEIERLENQLDRMEDQLQRIYRIDD